METEIAFVKCFVCDKELELDSHFSYDNPISISPVYSGLRFRSSGNFGSTIFDPIHSEELLEVIICDQCILAKKEEVKHIYRIKTRTTSESKPFDLSDIR